MSIIQHLIIEQYGQHVGKHQERLRVSEIKTSRTIVEAPLLHLEDVLIASRGVSISADAIAACTERGIPIHFIDGFGRPFAALYSAALTGTVLTRRAQLRAYDTERGLAAAKAFCVGKLRNQANLLRYAAKYRKTTDPETFAELRRLAAEVLDHVVEIEQLEGSTVDEVRAQLLSSEGRGAQRYWDGIRLLLPAECNWPGRRHQTASDPVNCALNYGYGILYGQVERAVILSGLDPYAGFLHADRSGKPSLVLDVIEQFRPAVVDRATTALFTKGTEVRLEADGRLDAESRKTIAQRIIDRLDSPTRYRSQETTLRSAIQRQCRELALFLRGDKSVYDPFVPNL